MFIYYLYLLLFLFLGTFRWQTGTDWNSYMSLFMDNNSIHDFFIDGYAYEKGYVLLNWGVKYLGGSYSNFLFVGTLINIFCFHAVAKKLFSERLVFALFLFFSVFMGGIFVTRQLLAASICFFSIIYIVERKIFPFTILIVFASLLHVSAIVFFFAYYIYNCRISVKQFIILFFVTLIVSYFLNSFFSTIVSSLSANSRIGTKLLIYTTGEQELGYSSLIMGIIKRVVLLPLFFYTEQKWQKQNSEIFSGMFNIYLLGTLLYFLFALSGFKEFVRISSYFQLIEIPLFYYTYTNLKKKWILLLIIPFCFMKIFSAIGMYYNLYVPFYLIFENPNRM